ncbi:MAG: PilZ domain-containing protein [Acidobacteriia bacterium]|nr:PilZ domain-containing protein [Terriglobia bacterium]
MLSELRAVRSVVPPYAHVQRYPRTPFSVPLTIRHLKPGGIQTTHGISLDISEGGLGALVEGTLHVGETVSVDLLLQQHALHSVAIIRHTSSLRSGFEFVGLTAEERQQIADEVAGREPS